MSHFVYKKRFMKEPKVQSSKGTLEDGAGKMSSDEKEHASQLGEVAAKEVKVDQLDQAKGVGVKELEYFDFEHVLVGKDPKVLHALYKCYCGEEFESRSQLMIHLEVVKNNVFENLFKCKVCGDHFELIEELNDHIKKLHYKARRERKQKKPNPTIS